MADVKQLLIETLEDEFDLPVLQQGSLTVEDVYPDAFFTFWNNETNDENFYDDNETQTIWNFDLNYYAIDPDEVNDILLVAKSVLKEVGFIVDGVGHDIMSDNPSHTGRGITLLYIDRVESEAQNG